MKRTKITELHSKTVAELQTQLQQLLKSLTQARLEKGAGRLKNTASVVHLADD
ncbi:MAG TPA: 50S ribosomal protein L29, partial [Candidatus Pacebacteria bacterium]|nr:50S ribosomal protein L29 [Candidatus Paceibacterota bacterium]